MCRYTYLVRMTDIAIEDIGRECAMLRVRMAARAVTRHFEDTIRPAGLKAPQFSLLVTLKAAPGLSATEMAERLGIDRTTLVRNLNLLERDGLIATAVDGRTRRKTLTKAGDKILARALPLWRTAQDSLVAAMGPPAWAEAKRSLRALRTAV